MVNQQMGKANQLLKHQKLIKQYVADGLNIAAIRILVNKKLEYPLTYHGFRSWMLKNNLIVSHEKRKEK